jgi:hypothetical protein
MQVQRYAYILLATLVALGCSNANEEPPADPVDTHDRGGDVEPDAGSPDTNTPGEDTNNTAPDAVSEGDIEDPVDVTPAEDDTTSLPSCVPGKIEITVDEKPADDVCHFTIPDPDAVIDAWPFQLFITQNSTTEALPRYEAAENCFGSGWYLISNYAPKAIGLCPWSCGKLETATIQLTWNCTPKPEYPPDSTDGTDGEDSTDEVDGVDTTDSSDGVDATDGSNECDNEGSIYGLVCAPDKQTYNSDVSVSVAFTDCNGNSQTVSVKSDSLGFYLLEGIPEGLVTVTMNGPGIDKSLPVWVVANQQTDATAFAKKECFTNLAPDECYNGATEYKLKQQGASKVVDIIIAVDTSGSMSQEAAAVQNNLNNFANFISSAAIDYHVILIANNSLCVAEPLGGPNCTDGNDFKHVKQAVYSTDALDKIIDTYSQYQDFLRPLAQTHFIVVTDDNSWESAQWFLQQSDGLSSPGYSKPFVFHSVVGTGPEPNVGCPTAASEGTVYLELSQATGGAIFPICTSQWASVYEQIAEVVVESTCGFPIPNWTAFSNAETIYVKQLIDGVDQEIDLPFVQNAEACDGAGFYAVADPPLLVLCPESCESLITGKLNLQWVCPADDTVNQ